MPETPGTAVVDSSPSVANFVGEMYGDFLNDEPESDAGAPPAATPDTPPSEGTDPSGTAGAPPAPADATAPLVPDSSTPTTESDPFEDSTPLRYTVNGEARQFDGITRFKEGGGIIDPEAMDKVVRVFTERDHLFERGREQHQQIDELGKLTEWPIQGPNGTTQMVSGREGVQAQRIAFANVVAELSELRQVLKDPMKIAELLLVEPDGQGGTRIVGVNEDAAKSIQQRVSLAQRENALQVRQWAAQRFGAAPAAPAASAQVTTQYDAAANAPSIVEHVIKTANLTGLTDADKQWAAQFVPQFVRTTTAQDVREFPADGLRVGEPMILPAFVALIRDRAQLRASTTAQVTTATTAARTNAANLAAAQNGKRSVARPAAAPPARTAAQISAAEQEAAEDAAYTARLTSAAGVMRSS